LNSNQSLGLAAGLAAALIGGGWQVATRLSTTTVLGPVELALLRYAIPAVLLLPIAWRTWFWPRGVPWAVWLCMFCGAGLPFGMVAMAGTRFAPAAHMGVLMAGASPLMAALLSWLLWRERADRRRAAGLALMAVGVLLLGGASLADWRAATWHGDALFLLAASLWAGYTLSFRRSGLSPWQAAALINLWSALALMLWLALRDATGTPLFAHANAAALGWQALWQGVLAGVLGLWTYSVAIQRLGAAPAAAFGALAPVVSAVGGWWWVGDRLSGVDAVAIAAAVLGVVLASGVLARTCRA
jgi:drug/metabolite transporter (DMT)-like permease